MSKRLWTAIGIALIAAASCVVTIAIVPAPQVEASQYCTESGSAPQTEEWVRTEAAIAQDSSRCGDGEVCRELCMVDQCERTTTPTGTFDCFSN